MSIRGEEILSKAVMVFMILVGAFFIITLVKGIVGAVSIEGKGLQILKATGVGALIGVVVALLNMFMVQKNRYERKVDLLTGKATPWRFVGSTLEGPFGDFIKFAAVGAFLGLIVGVWMRKPSAF